MAYQISSKENAQSCEEIIGSFPRQYRNFPGNIDISREMNNISPKYGSLRDVTRHGPLILWLPRIQDCIAIIPKQIINLVLDSTSVPCMITCLGCRYQFLS